MSQEFRREYLLRLPLPLPLPLPQLYSRAYNAKDACGRHDNAFYLCEALVKLAAAPLIAAYLDEAEHGAPRLRSSGNAMRNKAILRLLAAALLLAHAGLLAYGTAVHSPVIDEVGHMAAGLSHWQLGKFDLYHVNPPLVRMVAAVAGAVGGTEIRLVDIFRRAGARSEFAIGQNFITANGERSFWLFTWARWACIPFSLLGGYVCFRWARELYGDWSGLLALTLWCFGPYILANGQMITPDMGATALGVTAAYAFWRWLKRPGGEAVLAAGLVLGLTLLTKTTWIILFGLWPVLWLAWRLPDWRVTTGRTWLAQGLQLGAIFGLAVCVLNAGYLFQGSMRRLGDFAFVSDSLGGRSRPGVTIGSNRFTGSWLGSVPVPVPKDYLLGVDVQKRDFESHYNSYLRGEWRKPGWWYYYLYAMASKVPLGVWLLALLAVFLCLTRRGYAAPWRRARRPGAGGRGVGACQFTDGNEPPFALRFADFTVPVHLDEQGGAGAREARARGGVALRRRRGLGRGEQSAGLPAQPVLFQRTGRRPGERVRASGGQQHRLGPGPVVLARLAQGASRSAAAGPGLLRRL